MTRTVEDGVRLFNVIAGHDPADPLSVPGKREEDYLQFLDADGLEGKRIGVLRALVDHDDADAEILRLFLAALDDLRAAGAEVVDPVEIKAFFEIADEMNYCRRFRYDVGQYLATLDDPPFIDVNTVLDTGEYAPQSQEAFDYYAGSPLDTRPDDWDEPCPTWPNDPMRNQLLANTIALMDAERLDALVFPTWSNPPAPIDDVALTGCRPARRDGSDGILAGQATGRAAVRRAPVRRGYVVRDSLCL